MTIITLPLRQPQNSSHLPDLLEEAAQEWGRVGSQMELLAEQLGILSAQRRVLAGVAAARLVRDKHPTASTLVFSVRDGRPIVLFQVLDGQGLILPAHRTGAWADEVLATVLEEDLNLLAQTAGVELASTSLRIELDQVIAALPAVRSEALLEAAA